VPVLDANHDLAHPVEANTAWSESYYFNAYDPPTDTGFFTRIGVRPNEGTIDVGMSLWLPNDELAEYRFMREQRTMIDSDLEVGGVRYEMREPMQQWHLTMDADALVKPIRGDGDPRTAHVALDVTFDALTPAIGADGQGREGSGASVATGQSVGKGHLEQAGRWTGTVTVDGITHAWTEARGNRDKSWGPRRWGGPRMWRWFSINFGDDVHFGGIRIGTEAGDLHRGWVWRDGEATSISEWIVKTELEDDGLTHRVSHVTAHDKAGRTHQLRADLLRVAGMPEAPVTQPRTIVAEGLARWSYEDRTGYGISEYLHQLDDQGRPAIPIE
jgi:hypothetical protein